MRPTSLVLIRHGESQAQVDEYVAGHETCSGLSPLGRRQAASLRRRFESSGELGQVDAVYTSLQARAIETADIIGPAVLGEGIEVRQDCDWCEIHPGIAEGLTWEELRERHPIEGDPDHPYRRRVAGAETWAELYQRVARQMRRITRDHAGERVVVVCHGGIVGATMVCHGDVPIEQGFEVVRSVVNTSVTEWRHTAGTWRLIRFNDAHHLATLDPS